jgi:hypothetical protein
MQEVSGIGYEVAAISGDVACRLQDRLVVKITRGGGDGIFYKTVRIVEARRMG